MAPAEAASAVAGWYSAKQAGDGALALPAEAASVAFAGPAGALAGWSSAFGARDGALASRVEAASAVAGWRAAEQAGAGMAFAGPVGAVAGWSSAVAARDGAFASRVEAASAVAGWRVAEQSGASMALAGPGGALSGWSSAERVRDGANPPAGWFFAKQASVLVARGGAQMSSAQAANAWSGWTSAEHGSVLIARDGARNVPAQAASASAGWYLAEQAHVSQPAAAALLERSLANQVRVLVARDGVLMMASEPAEGSLPGSATFLWSAGVAGWLTAERATDFAVPPAVPHARGSGERAHLLGGSAMGRWYSAPIVRRYVVAMAASAAKGQTCSPHAAMATSPALAGVASAGGVVVDVEGKVVHPGVQVLAAGARVYEALAAAGGALPGVDVTALDLARPVADGEQLRVGIAGAPSPVVGVPQASVGGGSRGKRGRPAQPVNLNTATLEQLESVPDIGPSLAQRILDWRAEHGRFASVSQLRQVRGIGERKFADMCDSVTV
ncbi:comEA protein [Catenulispora sp. GAS73]|uniref:ComEA family DNA-binding protein n=1 Tax=Catenulispora sp. GAS73 TaxID=3156269 RepID=UPI003516259F